MDFLLGSDPELMAREKKTGRLVSAIPFIPEGKGEGRPLDAAGQNRVLHDNVLIEYNTAPARSEIEWVDTHAEVLRAIQKILDASGLELHLQASADYPTSELKHPEARKFACEPDWNAWTLDVNEVSAAAAKRPFRSAGGHLHVGKAEGNAALNEILDDDFGKINTVKALDIFAGIPSVFLDKDPTAAARRKLYGGAGAHRPKVEYGVEYRALGNWWLRSPDYTRVIYQLAEAALEQLVAGRLGEVLEGIGEAKIQTIINKSKVKDARQVYAQHILPTLPAALATAIADLDAGTPAPFQQAWKLAA